jgi:hypothetical protein
MRRKSRAALAIMGVVALVGTQAGARSENSENRFSRGCSEATLRGAYGIQIQGTRPVGSTTAAAASLRSTTKRGPSVASARRTGRDSALIR